MKREAQPIRTLLPSTIATVGKGKGNLPQNPHQSGALLIRHNEVSFSLCPFLTLSLWERAGVRECDFSLNRAASIVPNPTATNPIATTPVKAAPAAVLRTTLDAELQARVEALLADRARALPPKVSLAALVMENDSLSIRAYVGSADFSDNDRFAHVDMTQGIRSPGSTLKPFLYALALDEGLIHSESLLVDAPQSFGGYAPGNFQASFSGPVSVSEALQRSLNVPAVDLLDRLGPVRFASTLRAGGVRLRMEDGATPNLSLILGGAGTTLEELVGAYRALATGGMAGRPRLTPEAPRVEARLMSAGAAWIVREILEVGGRPERPFEEGGSRGGFAWKTGTSFGFRDAWALGVTDRYTVGIWIGRPDGTPNPGFFGANSAAPLARDIAAVLPQAAALRAPRPPEVEAVSVCWPLGLAKAATPPGMCHRTRTAWALQQGVPPTLSDRGRPGSLRETVMIDAKSGLRVTAACSRPGMTVVSEEVARWPAHLAPWLAADQVPQLPPWRPGCAPPSAREAGLVLRGIDEGSVLRPPNGAGVNSLGRREAMLSLRVSGAGGKVFWLRDGVLAATQPAGEAFKLSVQQDGHYAVTAMDEQGR
ncbi:MAG: hypothetical protein JNM52_03340, partial [Betaproteobacteria bacterium]|nr:hypothetical protein [Betaproteobacteria bacterium]